MAQKGAHQKGTRPAGSQRSSANVFRRADSGRRAGTEGTRPQGEETAQIVGEATKEAGSQRYPRGHGQSAGRVGNSTPKQNLRTISRRE